MARVPEYVNQQNLDPGAVRHRMRALDRRGDPTARVLRSAGGALEDASRVTQKVIDTNNRDNAFQVAMDEEKRRAEFELERGKFLENPQSPDGKGISEGIQGIYRKYFPNDVDPEQVPEHLRQTAKSHQVWKNNVIQNAVDTENRAISEYQKDQVRQSGELALKRVYRDPSLAEQEAAAYAEKIGLVRGLDANARRDLSEDFANRAADIAAEGWYDKAPATFAAALKKGDGIFKNMSAKKMAQWDNRIEADAKRAEARIRSENSIELKRVVENTYAELSATGVSTQPPITREQFAASSPKSWSAEKVDNAYNDLMTGLAATAATFKAKDGTQEEQQAVLDSIKPKAGETDYAAKSKLYAATASQFAKANAAFDDNAADATATYDESTRELIKKGIKTPEDRQRLWDRQTKFENEPERKAVFTKGELAAAVKISNDNNLNPEEKTTTLASLMRTVGDDPVMKRRALQQILESKVDPTLITTSALLLDNDPANDSNAHFIMGAVANLKAAGGNKGKEAKAAKQMASDAMLSRGGVGDAFFGGQTSNGQDLELRKAYGDTLGNMTAYIQAQDSISTEEAFERAKDIVFGGLKAKSARAFEWTGFTGYEPPREWQKGGENLDMLQNTNILAIPFENMDIDTTVTAVQASAVEIIKNAQPHIDRMVNAAVAASRERAKAAGTTGEQAKAEEQKLRAEIRRGMTLRATSGGTTLSLRFPYGYDKTVGDENGEPVIFPANRSLAIMQERDNE